MWSFPDSAPPLAVHTTLGTGLRTRSFAAALARVEGLLAHATDVVLEHVDLSVYEPASRRLAESAHAPPTDGTCTCLGGSTKVGDPAALFRKFPHTHDALAGEAWQRFGAPTHFGHYVIRGGPCLVDWHWIVEDPVLGPQALAAWTPFVAANDKGMVATSEKGSWHERPLVSVEATWTLRLLDRRGNPVAHPFPRSRVYARLRAASATATFELVLPHEAATKAFHADCAAVNEALGITLSAKGWKLNAPKKKGGGRAVKKLPEP